MSRDNESSIDNELEELQLQLAAISLRITAIRNRTGGRGNARRRPPRIGDRVRFTIPGRQGYTEGTIVGITTHRVQIQEAGQTYVHSRAPHNVIVI